MHSDKCVDETPHKMYIAITSESFLIPFPNWLPPLSFGGNHLVSLFISFASSRTSKKWNHIRRYFYIRFISLSVSGLRAASVAFHGQAKVAFTASQGGIRLRINTSQVNVLGWVLRVCSSSRLVQLQKTCRAETGLDQDHRPLVFTSCFLSQTPWDKSLYLIPCIIYWESEQQCWCSVLSDSSPPPGL